jgi:hypothetical protein
MRRIVFVVAAFLALPSAQADALTVRDVVELTRAGLGEEVLLALIEVDQSVFPIDTPTIKSLKEAGVGDRVIAAMVRSARTRPPLDPEPLIAEVAPRAPEPQVVVIDHHSPERVREVPVAVPVPVYFPVVQRSRFPRHVDRNDRFDHVVNTHIPGIPGSDYGRPRSDSKPDHPAKPVYWGTSGTLRPDAWKPK